MEECRRLFEHVRSHPEDARANARALADKLGISASLVEQFQDALPDDSAKAPPLAPHIQERGRAGFWGPTIFREWSAFLVITSILIVIFDLVLGAVRAVQATVADFIRPGAILLIVLTIGVQLLCVYWHGMARRALWGAFICAAITDLVTMTTFQPAFQIGAPELLVFALFFTGYLIVMLPIATLGAYSNMRREMSLRAHLSRQELLDRLLEVRDTLRDQASQNETSVKRTTRRWLDILRHRILPVSFAMGIVMSLGLMIPMAIMDPQGRMLNPETASQTTEMPGLLFVMIAALAMSFVIQVYLGFLAGGPLQALKAMAAYAVASYLTYLLPIGPFGPGRSEYFSADQYLASYGMIFASGLVGGLGALVERGAARQRLVLSNDPVALHAEMLDLEWKLRPQTRQVCVMVVDAERSSLMKSESDPLEAEWTFREYQKYLAEVSGAYMGTVHSTAGDGAVIGFSDISQAFEAARQIQAQLADFNTRVNRLKRPFRLRIGLHIGEVQGELEKVQFTAVIDIAAHVEKVCLPGEVAMTEPIAAALPHVPVHELSRDVDGFVVFGTGRPVAAKVGFQV